MSSVNPYAAFRALGRSLSALRGLSTCSGEIIEASARLTLQPSHPVAGPAACLQPFSSFHSAFSTSASASASNQQGDDLGKRFEQLYSWLDSEGVPKELAAKVLELPLIHRATAAEQMQGRITNLWSLMKATTPQQRQALFQQAPSTVNLLGMQAESVTLKMNALQQLLHSRLGLSQESVQQMVSARATVLKFSPENIAEKIACLVQLLELPAGQVVQQVLLKEPQLLSNSADTLAAKINCLLRTQLLDKQGVVKLAQQWPRVLGQGEETLQQRAAAVLEACDKLCVADPKKAVAGNLSVFSQNPETLRVRLGVILAYAAAHKPSRQQLASSRSAFYLLLRPNARYDFLTYVLQQQQHSSSAGSGRSGTAGGPDIMGSSNGAKVGSKRSSKKGSYGASSSSAEPAGSGASADQWPKMVDVLRAKSKEFDDLVSARYPGFAAWQLKQQQQQQEE